MPGRTKRTQRTHRLATPATAERHAAPRAPAERFGIHGTSVASDATTANAAQAGMDVQLFIPPSTIESATFTATTPNSAATSARRRVGWAVGTVSLMSRRALRAQGLLRGRLVGRRVEPAGELGRVERAGEPAAGADEREASAAALGVALHLEDQAERRAVGERQARDVEEEESRARVEELLRLGPQRLGDLEPRLARDANRRLRPVEPRLELEAPHGVPPSVPRSRARAAPSR